jgi:MFS family permease
MNAAFRLAASRLASLTAGSAAYIALISAIYNETGSALWVSAALFFGVVGSVIGAPAAGWIGDRFERRRVMVGSDLAAAMVAAVMALTVDSALALALLFGLLAVVQSPFEPSSASAMPNLVPPEKLPRANALVAATASASYLLGPLLGGLLLGAGASAGQLLAVDAVSFLVSAALVVSIRRPFGLGGGTESEPGIWAGVRLIVDEPVLRVLVTATIVSLLGMGMVNVANYPLSIHLGGGTEGYGALEALLGGGGLVGAAIAARMLNVSRAPLVITVMYAVSGLGLLLAGLAPVLAVALAGMAIAGAGRGLGDVADTTLVQARTDDARRSRVFAAQDGAAHAAYSAAMLAGGLLVSAGGARLGVLTAGACGLAAAVVASRMLSRPGRSTSTRSDRTAPTDTRPTAPSDPREPDPQR